MGIKREALLTLRPGLCLNSIDQGTKDGRKGREMDYDDPPPVPPELAHSLLISNVQPLLIGLWVTIALWTVEVMLAIKWYQKYWSKDHWLVKIAILVVVLNETTALVTTSWEVYEICITHWSDISILIKLRWQTKVHPLFIGISSAILQVYLLVRYFRIANNKWITGLLGLGIGASFATCIRLVVILIHQHPYPSPDMDGVPRMVTAWLITASVVDILIALALAFCVYKMRRKILAKGTKRLLGQVIQISFETGGLTSALQIAALITYLCGRGKATNNGIAYPLRTTLGLVFFYNLLVRSSLLRTNAPSESPTFSLTEPQSWSRWKMWRRRERELEIGVSVEVVQETVKSDADEHAISLDSAAAYYRSRSRALAAVPSRVVEEVEVENDVSFGELEKGSVVT
ncbi:hypothetical protein BT69DRAFT_1284859 [Atractiella rhizophila]|nr:hypothetical protein BT69DRAFT_1284859 [Atractiella rhizophila]